MDNPTAPGFYWAVVPSEGDDPRPVEVMENELFDDNLCFYITGYEIPYGLSDAVWLAPADPPTSSATAQQRTVNDDRT